MTRAALSAAATRGLAVRIMREQPVYVCELSGPVFLDGLKKSLQSKIRRSMRLYEQRGPLTVRIARTGEERAAAWERLKALHREGWKARNAAGVFDNPHLTAFHERLQRNAPDGFHLFEVKAGADTIAVLYNFAHGKSVLNYQGGFDFENDNRLAPGFVAHVLAAQHYRDAGFEIYDLLAGEADYKARLGRADRTLTSLVIERSTWRNRLRAVLKR
jgi:CelD/BcsL family acetyltransferase involved in cellulose biosynthesis